MSKWQTMDSAPKAGMTRLLLTYWDQDYQWFHMGFWDETHGGHWAVWFTGEPIHPTHWMPRPPEPSAK